MTEPLTSDQPFINRLTEIVQANLKNESFGVNDLARELNMTQYRLSKKLYSIKGKKVNQFIREIRLNKARELLTSSETTASEVAYKVGFSSPAYFNKCFHEAFGFSPGKVIRDNVPASGPIEGEIKKNPEKSRRWLFISGIIIFILIISAFFLKNLQNSKRNLSDRRISIAVMPFQNLTNDTIFKVWEEGIQESLISWLSNSEELKITRKEAIYTLLKAQSSSNLASVSPGLAGKLSYNLEASMFIVGSIKKAGTMIQLDAELISTKTKEVLKSFEINVSSKGDIDFESIDALRKNVTNFLLISELIKQNPWLKNFPRVSTKSPEALKYYIYGYRAYNKADWATAQSWLLKSLTADSNYFDAMSRLYHTYKNLGMMEQALPWLLKLHNERNQMPELNQLYTNWSYAEIFESPEVRIKYLRQLQEIDGDGNYYYLIGATYVRSKQFQKAVPEFERYLDISRKKGIKFLKDNWVYPALGEAYHLTGQFIKEDKLLKEAWKINDDHNSVYFSWIIRDRGSLALSEGDTVAANKYIKEFISVRKENLNSEADISEGLGDMYWLAEKWDKGEAYYRKALSLEPENPSRMNILANRLIERNKNPEEVNQLMDRALERARNKYDYFNYSNTKGYGLFKAGKYQEALDVLQKTWDETPFRFFVLKSHLEEVRKAITAH